MKFALAALLALISCTVTAEIYKWTDKHGVVHYEDRQPEVTGKGAPPKVETVEVSPIQILEDGHVNNTNKENEGLFTQWLSKAENLQIDMMQSIRQKIAEWRNATPVITNDTIAQQQNAARQPSIKNNTVELYTAAWCGACKKAKRWLNERNITYKEYDVEKNSKAALRMRELGGGNGVPFAVINGKKFQGFDPNGYQAALR